MAQGVLGAGLAGDPVPLVSLASAVVGPWGTGLLFATILLSTAGYMSADVLCCPRVFAALAERGQWPRSFAAVHPRFKTPALAICAYALVCALVAWTGSFRQLVIATTSGTLVLYLICCLGLLRLRARNIATGGPPFRAPGGSSVPVAAAAIILWLLSTLSWPEFLATLSLVVGAGLFYAWQERRRSSPGAPITGATAESVASAAPSSRARPRRQAHRIVVCPLARARSGEPASASKLRKHGIDFDHAQALWQDPDRLEIPARSTDEPRLQVNGRIDNRVWSAFTTIREGRVRITSVRRAREEEGRRFTSGVDAPVAHC